MKRVIAFLFFLSIVICVYAGDECNSKIIYATRLYEQGLYETARERFDYCLRHCGENYIKVCNDWINKCDSMIVVKKQQQNHRIQIEKEAVLRHEKEVIERAKRREHNRLVYLSVYSDVPGRFNRIENQLKSNLHWTNDSLEAYWFVRVAVEIFEQPAIEQMRCYRVEAVVEVDNATELDFETKSAFVFDEGRCYINTDKSKQYVADMIYDNNKDHHLYEEIEAGVRRLIEIDNDSVQYQLEEKNNVVVYIDYEDPSMQSTSITEPLQNRLKFHFKEFGYTVKNNDKKIESILQGILGEEPGRVSPAKITSIKEEGVDKVCYVKIMVRNYDYEPFEFYFYCHFIDVSTNSVLKICSYPYRDEKVIENLKITEFSDKEDMEFVADVLAYQLGLLSEQKVSFLISNLITILEEDSVARIRRANIVRSFVPGLYQLNNKKQVGALMLAGEALGIGGIIVSQVKRVENINKMNNTTNVDLKRAYADKANTWTIVRNVSIGAAAAVYVWNLVDAWISISKQKTGNIVLKPVVTDESAALSLSINF